MYHVDWGGSACGEATGMAEQRKDRITWIRRNWLG